MTRLLLVSAFLLSICAQGNAQYRWDIGLHLGASNYLGDIGGKDKPRRDFINDIKLNQTQFAAGIHVRYRITRNWAATAMFMYGRVEGDDEETTYAPRRGRNLQFRNDLYELSLRAEMMLYSDNDLTNRGYYNPTFNLYAFLGVAGIKHNPQGFLKNPPQGIEQGWYDLREYRTEGQAEEYSEFTFAFPVGLGLYLTHNRQWRFGWELGYRLTTTDYLDDISTDYAREDELDGDLAIALANQTTPEVIMEAFDDPAFIYNYHYQFDAPETASNPRGIESNKDGYIFSTLSVAFLIPDKSSFSRSKHKWLKGRSKRRKARAKF